MSVIISMRCQLLVNLKYHRTAFILTNLRIVGTHKMSYTLMLKNPLITSLIGTYILVYNKGDFYMEILHVYGKVFIFRDVILHMLHVTGGKRCSPMVKGCMVGCAVEGGFNGKPDEKSKPLLNLDTTGEYLNFSLNPISHHSNPASFLLTNILHLLLYKSLQDSILALIHSKLQSR